MIPGCHASNLDANSGSDVRSAAIDLQADETGDHRRSVTIAWLSLFLVGGRHRGTNEAVQRSKLRKGEFMSKKPAAIRIAPYGRVQLEQLKIRGTVFDFVKNIT